jgi:Domain of unknown function (DUF4129)
LTPSAEEARAEARSILAEERFSDSELPRPLRGPLEWLGERLNGVFGAIADVVPGGESVLWLVLAALVLLGALAVGIRLARARGASSPDARSTRAGRLPSAAALERQANQAERDGELELALRLRFRAGVLRLVERRVLDDPSSATTGAIVRRLRSEPFARGAAVFDEVVYGRRAPTNEDARIVREGWKAVLAR